MNFQESLEYLYTRLPMFQRVGAAALKPNLSNTLELLNAVGNPHLSLKCIHIAGTNGKGTTAHALASILSEAGYTTGLYTSPHLKSFRERIKINGEEISEDFIGAFVTSITDTIERINPSFFEVTFVMSMVYFDDKKVDIAVIETGLGGRLDSTNVIDPIFSLITMIGWDHADLLGDTLEKIASEKAGIIKKSRPVIIGANQPELLWIFKDKAELENAPLVLCSEIHIQETIRSHNHVQFTLSSEFETIQLETDLTARYFLKNVPGVYQAVRQLRSLGWLISDENISTGFKRVKEKTGLKGRWQVLGNQPLIVSDISHNLPGIQELLDQIKRVNPDHLHLIFGVVRDKDLTKLLQILPQQGVSYYFTQSSVPRALPVEELMVEANRYGLYGNQFLQVNEAIEEAKNLAGKNDLIVITGSTFVVAEIDGL